MVVQETPMEEERPTAQPDATKVQGDTQRDVEARTEQPKESPEISSMANPNADQEPTTEADEIPAELEAMAEPSPEDAPLRDIGTAVETEKTTP